MMTLYRSMLEQRPAAALKEIRGVKLVYFTHSLESCCDHGNAHFLRGVLRELVRSGHLVEVWQPKDAWSLNNLLLEHGSEGLDVFRNTYPEIECLSV